MPNLSLFLSQAFNGIALGSLLSLISVGLTIILGTLGVLNFAHGAVFMVGAYVGYQVSVYTGSLVAAVVAGVLFTALLGLFLERFFVRYFYKRSPEDQILVTFGLGIVVTELVRQIFGGVAKHVAVPQWSSGIVSIGSLIYPKYRVIAIGVVAAALIVLYLALYRTKVGLVVRAGIEDILMVNALGIDARKVFLAVFVIGSAAAGFAGVIDAPIVAVTPDMGNEVLVMSFVVVVIGGLGSFGGAIVGGLVAGEVLSLVSMFDAAYSQVALFLVMALILILRPSGLFGTLGRT